MPNENTHSPSASEPRVTVFRITESGTIRHGESISIRGFTHMGKLCRDYLRFERVEEDMTFNDFLPASRIYEDSFAAAVLQFGKREDLCAVFDINMDEQLFSSLEENGKWTTYPMKAVTVAAHHAYNDIHRSPLRTIAIFHEHIVGKDIQLPLEEAGQLPGMGM